MKKLVFLTALFMLFSGNVSAHALYATAQFDGNTITGKAYYSDMTPAAETYVEAYVNGSKEPVISGKTDKSGRFSLNFQGEGIVKIVVEGEEGHRVNIVADKLSSSPKSTMDLTLIREDIAQLKDKIYWRDVIGGLGYIVGLFGLWAWFSAKQELGARKQK
ncbi:nickel transport protein [Cricetibacter osteomyelitidis]|uniref:Nickel transport protein n=1 Tax=Cricetibacter osteomyelitidis TaxID=1521931 RepID=A0A4R2T5K7_9PAST|nr:carboxypeptidase regulatory-like domain-containing protein [Cricetibacter osteomyelitidis]TCP97710.1 nickel transport protein [Cricetibacter osteomyelitidis]